ncbi:hypothetical protein EDC04DRAFT_2910325 [Pisolithus marmoratus]|nr:hypothetical protein EDC04DRAFT_2910325 [Pisolithus marmoratus]
MIKLQDWHYLAAIYLALSQILPSHSLTGPMPTQAIPSTSLGIASSMLFMYDYALTFAKEIDLFWLQPRQTWGFAFFITNRYIGLLARVPFLLENVFPSSSGSPWWEHTRPGLYL